MKQPLPPGAVLGQTLFYADGKILHVYYHRRLAFIRDGAGDYPANPDTGVREPHPDEGSEPGDLCYETLGLYYDYDMPETGWGD